MRHHHGFSGPLARIRKTAIFVRSGDGGDEHGGPTIERDELARVTALGKDDIGPAASATGHYFTPLLISAIARLFIIVARMSSSF